MIWNLELPAAFGNAIRIVNDFSSTVLLMYQNIQFT